jgi:transcription antitermination protein NusB
MNRKAAREWLIHTFYQMDLRDEMTEVYFAYAFRNIEGPVSEPSQSYLDAVFKSFMTNKDPIDEAISKHLIDWTIERINKVDLAILRVAVTELMFIEDIPDSVSVKEAVDLSKKYGDEESAGFVNGILGKISHE